MSKIHVTVHAINKAKIYGTNWEQVLVKCKTQK